MSGRLRLCAAASSAELDGEAVILHLKDGRYYAVNGTGATLLRRLTQGGGASADDLAALLVTAHGIDLSRARRDVDAWLATMRAKHLVEDAPDGGPAGAPRS